LLTQIVEKQNYGKIFFELVKEIDLKREESLKVKIYHKEKIGLEMQMEM